MDIEECLDRVQAELTDQELSWKKLNTCFQERDYICLPDAAESCLRNASKVYLLYRELLLSLCELMPSASQSVNVYELCRELPGISVERSKEFDFPVYRITLPFLLPNKRKRKAERNDIITESVRDAVSRFCRGHHITPFTYATIIFLSHYQNGSVTIDNDNLDSAVIINSLNGRLIRDDRPEVCNTMYYSKVSEKAITEIYVIDSDHDVELLAFIKSACHK